MNVLITGGTGSLGKFIVSKWHKERNITVMSRDEDKQQRMMKEYPNIKYILGDVRSYDDCLKSTYNQDLIIHTAALKRIEFGEDSPEQFIKTNILGTINMIKATQRNNIKNFILISTDKACEPINAYGMTKALAEKLVVNAGFNCVRYGNVNDSRGSVIPYWKSLKKQGKPLSVTNPDMTRFMISFEEAFELIMDATRIMNGGIYIPKLHSVRIGDLADAISSLPHKVVGERPGEKMHEVLISKDDFRRGYAVDFTSHYRIFNTPLGDKENNEYSSNTVNKITKKELKEYIDNI